MYCKNAQDFWDILKKIYEGDEKVKLAKIQVLRARFEGLKMTKEENIAGYLQRVNDIVKSIRGYGEEVKGEVVVLKVISSMTYKYEYKISTIEEGREIDKLTLNELHGIFTTYETRMGDGDPYIKEATFKVAKKVKDGSPKKYKVETTTSE